MSVRSAILLRTLAAAVVAALVLMLAVLPAEYGYDPTGTGEWLGLTRLAATPASALSVQRPELARDAIAFELLPYESLEYKYRLEAGAALVFSWRASGEVTYDLHAEPEGAEPGFAESFAQGKSTGESGSYLALFPGIHGWFWENRGDEKVTVTMVSTGFFTAATLFRDGFAYPREVAAGHPDTGIPLLR